MRAARQVLWGLLLALASVGIILGGLALSLVEGKMVAPAVLTSTFPPPTATPVVPSASPYPTETPTWTPTPPPTPSNCPPPPGWVVYIVQPGDILDTLAFRYNIPSIDLYQFNCLATATLEAGSLLYVPPTPTLTATLTLIPCGHPAGWVIYIVQHGDNLYRLSQAYGITVQELQRANCLGSNTLIVSGQRLYVPPWGTRTPTPTLTIPDTATPTETLVIPTETPTPTETTAPPSDTPTATDNPTPTSTNVP